MRPSALTVRDLIRGALAWLLLLAAAPAQAEKLPPIVGAYYFGVYSPKMFSENGRPMPRTLAREPWWAGVVDLFENKGSVSAWSGGDGGGFGHLKPLIGYYDVSNTEVVERHISQAVSRDLDFFMFYWYWNAARKTTAISDGLDSFRRAKNKSLMRYAVNVIAHPWENKFIIERSDFGNVIEQIFHLTEDENYLALDGRKIISIGDTRAIGDGQPATVEDFVAALRNRFTLASRPQPLILINPDLRDWNKIKGVDGAQCITPNSRAIGPDVDFRAYSRQLTAYYDAVNNLKPFAPCGLSNFDERPRYQTFVAEKERIRYFNNYSFEQFAENLRALRKWQQDAKDPLSRIMTLYAWNEWHEGGIIEPDVQHGFRYLDIIREELKTETIHEYENSAGEHIATRLLLPPPWTLRESWRVLTGPGRQHVRPAIGWCKANGEGGYLSLSTDCRDGHLAERFGYLTAAPHESGIGTPFFRCERGGKVELRRAQPCATNTPPVGFAP